MEEWGGDGASVRLQSFYSMLTACCGVKRPAESSVPGVGRGRRSIGVYFVQSPLREVHTCKVSEFTFGVGCRGRKGEGEGGGYKE